MKLTAFHRWLLRESGRDEPFLSLLILREVVENKNPQAFDLLELTGDKEYGPKTFVKAAQILLEQPL